MILYSVPLRSCKWLAFIASYSKGFYPFNYILDKDSPSFAQCEPASCFLHRLMNPSSSIEKESKWKPPWALYILYGSVTYLIFSRLKSSGLHSHSLLEDTPYLWRLLFFSECFPVLSFWDEANKTTYATPGDKISYSVLYAPSAILDSCSILNNLILFVIIDTSPLIDTYS